MLTRRTFGMMLAVLPCAVATSGPVTAESYPTRPIKLIVPQAAGGPTNSLARLIAQQLSAALDEPVVVDNRPGGGLMIGTRAAAAADPDGYTLLFAPPGPLTVSPAISRDLGYDPLKSFVPVALLARSPQILVVTPSLPAKSVHELVAYAKENSGKLNLGIPGFGTQPHLIGEQFKQRTGADIVIVPYKGGLILDLLAGRVQMYFGPASEVLSLVRAGKLRALATLNESRHPDLPDVPTMAEAGYGGFIESFWVGIVAPAGTPARIVAKLNATINQALQSTEIRSGLAKLEAEPSPGSPQQFGAFIAAETQKWMAIAKAAGITADRAAGAGVR